MIGGLKGIFWSWLPSMFTRKKKANIFKMWRKCSSVEKLLISSHVLGSKLVMGQRTSLFSLNHLVKTDKDGQHFPTAKPNNWCASFPAKFVLTSDIILSLNDYKKTTVYRKRQFSQATDCQNVDKEL